jgi:hypothetical protein
MLFNAVSNICFLPLVFRFFLLVCGQSVLRVNPISTVGTKDRKTCVRLEFNKGQRGNTFNSRGFDGSFLSLSSVLRIVFP